MCFGRAPGADQRTTFALNDKKSDPIAYPQKVSDMLGFLTSYHLPGSQYSGMRAHPQTSNPPKPFVLGASGATAELALIMELFCLFVGRIGEFLAEILANFQHQSAHRLVGVPGRALGRSRTVLLPWLFDG